MIIIFSIIVSLFSTNSTAVAKTVITNKIETKAVAKSTQDENSFKKVDMSKKRGKNKTSSGFQASTEKVSGNKMVVIAYTAFFMLMFFYLMFMVIKFNNLSKRFEDITLLKGEKDE